MNSNISEERLYRDDILRARKAALNKTNADLISDDVKSEVTVGKTLRGANVDLKTLRSIAGQLGVEMSDLFIFESETTA